MNLKSFGCSFIFGSELSDDHNKKVYASGSQLSWPAHLARHLDYNYLCYAKPGSGNLQIAERALSELAQDDEDNVYVIGWTYIDRFDYISINSPRWPGAPWTTILPVDTEPVAEMYYKNLHSEYQDKLTTLIYIKSVLDKLKQKNCQFIMTYMDDLLFDQRWHTTPAVIDLQEYIQPYMTQFDNANFLQWSKNNNFQISPQNNHPLEEAHRAAGDYMIKVFHKQNTVDR